MKILRARSPSIFRIFLRNEGCVKLISIRKWRKMLKTVSFRLKCVWIMGENEKEALTGSTFLLNVASKLNLLLSVRY